MKWDDGCINQTTAGDRLGLSVPAVEEPQIVLQWLVRLRRVAFTGQVAATLAAMGFLKIRLLWVGMMGGFRVIKLGVRRLIGTA